MNTSENPLLLPFSTPFETPPFDKIKEEYFLPALEKAIEIGKNEVDEIVNQNDEPTFENTIEALERSGEKVARVSSIFFNLNSAETNDEIQKIARDFSPKLSEYGNDIMLNARLFERVNKVYDAHSAATPPLGAGGLSKSEAPQSRNYGRRNTRSLSEEQRMLLEKTYRAFIQNGANLNDSKKEKLRELDQELAKLSLQFGENVLAETNDFELWIEDESDLAGLPADIKEAAAEAATEKGKTGRWLFTLHYPSYVPFITYSEKRELREKMTKAYGARAFQNNERNNEENVLKISQLRHERAQLLGYDTHAEYVLQERMAERPEKVKSFLDEILEAAKPAAEKEVEDLAAFAKKRDGIGTLQKWDFAFYSEKLKQEKFEIDDEKLKPFFTLQDTVRGAFETAQRLYGISFHERDDIPKYHNDVTVYEVKDLNGNHLAVFYADFHPRQGKRAGAWMTSYRSQKKINKTDIRPHVSIVCNFSKPTQTKPSLLTFREVLTLFHEFGHSLHGILASGTYASLSGTSVFWDFVELPSQVMENWCYEKECLDLFAAHYETGEKIPAEMVERLKKSANFMEGYATVRQVGLARLDLAWHAQDPSEIDSVKSLENKTLGETELLPEIETSNTSTSFSHIFQGGYSAGYYSYKWAEVLDADAFEYFKETGIFNPQTAKKFKRLLAAGGTVHPAKLYEEFRGKKPDAKALLRRAGLVEGQI